MKTLAVIGNTKNAGKTTIFNFVYRKKAADFKQIIVTSIGLNGEAVDQISGRAKPKIEILSGHYFVTEKHHLEKVAGLYELVMVFYPPAFSKCYVLGRALSDFKLVLEGPNTGDDLLKLKDHLQVKLPGALLLVDGSVDRSFLAKPTIASGFYFAILNGVGISAKNNSALFFQSLRLKEFSKKNLLNGIGPEFRWIILDVMGKVLASSQKPAFLDSELFRYLKSFRGKSAILYLNSALTESLAKRLESFKKITIVLDNFTLCKSSQVLGTNFKLLHKPKVIQIFERHEGWGQDSLPGTCNLFREVPGEIRI